MDLDDLADLNIVGVVFGVIAGLIGFIIGNMMMPESFLMKIIIFICCAVVGYFVSNGILNN